MLQRIFLYGPPGVGKSTIGALLAEKINFRFLDLDKEIVNYSGRDIKTIFKEDGEAGFREIERSLLFDVLKKQDVVVALGGGALVDKEVRNVVEKSGEIILLNASIEALIKRLESEYSERPLLNNVVDFQGNLDNLLKKRKNHYDSFSLTIDTSYLSPEIVTEIIQSSLGIFQLNTQQNKSHIRVVNNGLKNIGNFLKNTNHCRTIIVVSDTNVAHHYLEIILNSLKESGYKVFSVVIPPGEVNKKLDTVNALWEAFTNCEIERNSTVLALGGGVVSDLAGFAAATYLRGVNWVVVPTSLLSMVDASLGGKTGIDLPYGKNLVGAFHSPELVWVDPFLLETLPQGEFRSGLAEIIKHGIIADPVLFEMCSNGDDFIKDNIVKIINRAIAVKVRIVQEDPFEKGKRAALNLGHTLGHAIEKVTDFKIRHGEAVSIGIVQACKLSNELGLMAPDVTGKIKNTLSNVGLPVRIPDGLDTDELIAAMKLDKKKDRGEIRFVLPLEIGKVIWNVTIEDPKLIFKE